ncbi:MAG: lipid-A-disaccharide synthase [Acidiferrobacterales bacterium]|nr:lipid-A-disaccharide synthase [Acidiferrobacterales bacterium]
MKVAIVAGEKSGDYLGAELIQEIKKQYPRAEFIGLCGELMQQHGAISLAEMDKISLFGLDGLFSSLREILAIRKKLYNYFIQWQPDVFIGIDVPDFNLSLERKLKEKGIPIVHYVSPSVWAWRGHRINKIRRSIDLMLTLFPFEKKYYQTNNTPVEYVGHPLAKQILEWKVDDEIIEQLSIESLDFDGTRLVAVMPGSRMSEVTRLAPAMLDAVKELAKQYKNLKFVIPAANPRIKKQLLNLSNFDGDVIQIVDGHSRDVLALCHIAVLASGTAALEAALFAKPMVVMYKVSKISAFVYKNSITVRHYSLPNHLLAPPIVPELIQQEATAENLIAQVDKLLRDPDHYKNMQSALAEIAPKLNTQASQLAWQAIQRVLAINKVEHQP